MEDKVQGREEAEGKWMASFSIWEHPGLSVTLSQPDIGRPTASESFFVFSRSIQLLIIQGMSHSEAKRDDKTSENLERGTSTSLYFFQYLLLLFLSFSLSLFIIHFLQLCTSLPITHSLTLFFSVYVPLGIGIRVKGHCGNTLLSPCRYAYRRPWEDVVTSRKKRLRKQRDSESSKEIVKNKVKEWEN